MRLTRSIENLPIEADRNLIKRIAKMTYIVAEALKDLKEKEVLALVERAISAGGDVKGIVEELRRGMTSVGERFGCGDYFLSEVVYAAEIFKEAMEIVKPRLIAGGQYPNLGKIVIGTAWKDIHDIGKNIVSSYLASTGFEVHDLGVDVPPGRFIDEIHAKEAQILGISCLLTLAFDPMKETIKSLAERGLRDKIKVIIGGGPVDERVRQYVGADYCARDAFEAARICKEISNIGVYHGA